VINAIDAITESGTVYLDARVKPNCVEISVRDDGPGMSPEVLQQCTQPFFTTKGELGTGVGLSTVRETCAQHKGTLEIDSKVGVGTQMTMSFPTMLESH
ncbi:MAG: ATP-binding protein, partial [Bradymonadia bacterium]